MLNVELPDWDAHVTTLMSLVAAQMTYHLHLSVVDGHRFALRESYTLVSLLPCLVGLCVRVSDYNSAA